MRHTRKRVLLIGPGDERYRAYLLDQLAEVYDVWLVDTELADWVRPRISGFSRVPAFGLDQIMEAATQARRKVPLHGVVCWDERYVIEAADAATLLGLPSAGDAGARACRDKALTRARLRSAGVRQPRSLFINSVEDAAAFAFSIGYPVVVKPRGMGGSIGVALARNEADLHQRFAEAAEASREGAKAFCGGAIVESYVEGSEISVDGRIVEGVYTPLFIARKTVGLAPHFEETGHVVDARDPLLGDPKLLETLRAAHRAIGFENGITHAELKLTLNAPSVIEINGRLGGDLIPLLATYALGLSPGAIAGQIACGDTVRKEMPQNSGAAAVAFRYPTAPMTVTAVRLPPDLHDGAFSVSTRALARSGDRIAPPPEAHLARIGCAIAIGPEARTCRRFAECYADRIEAEAHVPEPLTAGE